MIRGAIMRFIVRTLITALLTGIGFYILLGVLGFQIVPAEESASAGGVAAGGPTREDALDALFGGGYSFDSMEKGEAVLVHEVGP